MAYFRCTTSGSGTGATITVSYDSEVYGQTLTCTDGTHTYTKTAASTGSTVFTVPNGGTWTISVVMYGHTYSQQVIVVSEYTCTLELWSATVNISTTATELYSQTITVKKGGSTIGSTAFDSSGSATYIAPEEGAYTFECTYSGQTYSASVNITEETTYSVSINVAHGLVLDDWLTAGGLNPSSYADLSEVLADEEAVRRLMTIHDAVDYLATAVEGDEMMETIIADNICAKWINLRDYALDVLSANTDIKAVMDEVDKYGYGEWVLEGQVPTMTSNTAPYGEAIASSTYTTSQPWRAFDGIIGSNDFWSPNGWNNWVGYHFLNPICVKKVKFRSYCQKESYKIQASNDGTTWIDIASGTTSNEFGFRDTIVDCSGNTDNYSYYNLLLISADPAPTSNPGVEFLQFYAYQPKGNVPIMTSNTAPYGEAMASSTYSTSYPAYYAFLDESNFGENNMWAKAASDSIGRIGYKFTNPVCVKKVSWDNGPNGNDAKTLKVVASNDGTTWIDITGSLNGTIGVNAHTEQEFDNDDYYIYWGIQILTYNQNTYWNVRHLQFYGREMKVSVPTMTSNTQPWGEASASTEYGGSGYMAWNAFDDSSSSKWNPSSADTYEQAYIQYDFKKPVVINLLYYHIRQTLYTFKVLGSNDNFVTSELIKDNINVRDTSTGLIILNNEKSFKQYRIVLLDGNPTMAAIEMYTIQFFGFDYSERDWNTEHPMRYLYDHGVELEEVEAVTTYGTCEKRASSLFIKSGTSTGQGASFTTSNTIDTSDYTLCRNCSEREAAISDSTPSNSLNFGLASTKERTQQSDKLAEKQYYGNMGDLPYNNNLDISSVNQSCYVYFATGGGANGKLEITEWWLE